MDNTFRVCRIQGVGQLNAQNKELFHRHWSAPQFALQRAALERFHDDKELPIFIAYVIDRTDVGVVEGRSGPRLAPEPLHRLPRPRQVFRQQLQRDLASQAYVLR